MLTTNDNGRRRLTEERGPARALATGHAVWVSVLAAMAFLAAGFGGRSACAQSQSKEVREHVKHATVEVFTAISKSTKGDTPMGSGSGFFVNRTGLCISNNHVVDPTHRKPRWEKQRMAYSELNRLVWTVVVDPGTDDEKEYEAFVLYQNDLADQAILQAYGEDGEFLETPHYLKLVPGHRLKIGQKIWCYGFPGGDSRKGDKGEHPEVAISEGHIVSMPRRPDGDMKMVNTDVMADPGNSGGPMVDIAGYCVGTATLKPVAEFEGRAHQSALVPPDLTRDFITFAFQRGKLEFGIDLEPFYTHLVGRDGFVDVAGYPRQPSTDCMFLEDGSRICGAPAEKSITLPTPLGKLTLPCAQMAYLLEQDEEYGIILMDGGERLPFNRDEAAIQFKPTGGTTLEQDLSEVRAVAFRKNGELPDRPRGENLLLGGDNYHLLLTKAAHDVQFATDVGAVSRPLRSIRTIETNGDGDQVVHYADGSKMVGTFAEQGIGVTLAISGVPQTISLRDVRSATVDVIDSDKRRKREMRLADLFHKASPGLQAIAEQLQEGKVTGVKRELAAQLSPQVFNRLGSVKKDHLRLLDATCDWLNGDYAAAQRGFRKLKKSDDEGLKWYAHARVAVLERFPDGDFDGRPLSDPKVYKQAGAVIARDVLHRAREVLGEREAPAPENRGLFMRIRKQIERVSDELMIASQLGSKVADVAVVWLWSWQSDLLYYELRRLQEEIKEKQEEVGRLQGAAREYTGRRLEKDIRRLEKTAEVTQEWSQNLRARLDELGFIINDPDLDLLD